MPRIKYRWAQKKRIRIGRTIAKEMTHNASEAVNVENNQGAPTGAEYIGPGICPVKRAGDLLRSDDQHVTFLPSLPKTARRSAWVIRAALAGMYTNCKARRRCSELLAGVPCCK